MGTASAGDQAWAHDASTAFHNPAGMTLLDGDQFMVGAGIVSSTVEFDPAADTPHSGGDGGDAGGIAPLGGSFYVHSLSEDLKVGLSFVSLSGAILDYGNTWTGRYQCQEVSIFTMFLNSSLGYDVFCLYEIKTQAKMPGTLYVKITT